MKRRLCLSLAMCVAVVSNAFGDPAARPNIVFVLLDNVGQEWFGSYGSLEGCTPQMDRLAQTGVRFAHCYTSPICSVTRVCALTGRYPFRTGWTFHHDAGIYGGGNFDWRREGTFARLLRDAGYATCLAGKWQINNFNEAGQENCLREHGFDEYLVSPGARNDSKYWDPLLIRNGVRALHAKAYAPDLFTDFAIDFMRRERERPFMVYFPITLVHAPLSPTPLSGEGQTSPRQRFVEALSYADRLVGRLVEALERLGLRDRTLLFISADNGTDLKITAQTRSGPVAARPYSMAEESIDMPLIVNGPKLVPAGRVGGLADFSDLLPTFAELAGVGLPAGLKVDGRSFAPWLLGRESRTPRRWIHTAFQDVRVVRDDRYKLFSSGALFDLKEDPMETRDLAASHEKVAVAARARLEAVLKSFPADAPQGFEPQSITARAFRARQSPAGQGTPRPASPR